MLLIDTDELARRSAAGEGDALDKLLTQIRPEVLRRCRRLVHNPLDAEDTCQDVLLTVSQRITSFEGRSRFSTWLYPVVANAITDSHRRRRRRQSVLGDGILASSDPHISAIVGNRIDLLSALAQTAPTFATPVLLRDGWGFGYQEIATLLEIPEGTVKSRVHEGRRRLQRTLAG